MKTYQMKGDLKRSPFFCYYISIYTFIGIIFEPLKSLVDKLFCLIKAHKKHKLTFIPKIPQP